MKRVALFSFILVLVVVLSASKKHTTIFIIGDSTAANKSSFDTNPERGWGMVLQGFFDESIWVDNHAVNGRSSKSFIDEGRWQKVFDKIKPGDYVFIQFGHNDEKADPRRHTEPGSTFDDNLRKFVRETRLKGGIPVLFNAVVRRNFYQQTDITIEDESLRNTQYADEIVNSDTLIDTHGAYLLSPRKVAREMNVPFVDANKITHDLEQSMGVDGSRKLHMWFKPDEVPSIPNGRQDNTHYNVYGARIVAGLLADAIGEEIPVLVKHIRHYDYVVSKQGKGNYLSLQEAVDEAPMGATILVLDGEWPSPQITKGKLIKLVKFSDVRIAK
ncbi:MAG: rhamnogalacturonan acetylesterase [Prevotella sp.]|nr:rhamnogalacturonan acetylesterase [Prevotella sp.]